MHSWRDHELLRRALDVFGLASLAEGEEAPAEVRRARRAARARARTATSREADRLRAEIDAAGWVVRDVAAASSSSRSGDARPGLRPPRRARGAARAAAGARAVGDRACARGRGVACATRRGMQVKPDRELTDAAGTRDHQGVVAWAEPYRYADAWELAATERPLLVCLDRVTDPRNLGAVCRSAEGAAATGVVVPAHGSAACHARGREGVGRRGRAPPGGGRAEPRPLPRRRSRAPTSGSTRAAGDEVRRCGRPTSPAAPRSSSAPRGKGCARSCAGRVTSGLDSARGADRVAERERRRARLLLEAKRQRSA